MEVGISTLSKAYSLETAEPKPLASFLHLSDLHVGMGSSKWLWPTIKTEFLRDLGVLLQKVKILDVVIFSGDLTQTGSVEEYEKLALILEELWVVFRRAGLNPAFFAVPGNHDLKRSDALHPTNKALGDWWNDQSLREGFWRREPADYIDFITKAFSEYTNFLSALRGRGIPMATDVVVGIIPGDLSVVMHLNGKRIGLVGLNSSWLQLGAGDYEGKLSIDARQILALTADDPDAWCAKNDINILITHHPDSWLHPKSLAEWKSEIYLSERFCCHLFGHMHEQLTSVISISGGLDKRGFQAASLFGLESFSNGAGDRTHGYSILQLLDVDNSIRVRQWPRSDIIAADGRRKIDRNLKYNLSDEGYFDTYLNAKDIGPHLNVQERDVARLLAPKADPSILLSLRRAFPMSRGGAQVRKVEQRIAVDALKRSRVIWLVSDWGLGADEFVRVVQDQYLGLDSRLYLLDMSRIGGHRDFGREFKIDLGCTLVEFCELLSNQGKCFLLLDDVPATGRDGAGQQLEDVVAGVADVVLQYCQNVTLIVRSRIAPLNQSIKILSLKPLDVADTSVYVQSHESGGIDLANGDVLAKIFRHTDGMPIRIGAVLRDARIVGIDHLHTVNTDIAGKAAASIASPPGLSEAIGILADSNNPDERRAFRLLGVLTVFPRGEYLATLRRFDRNPFYTQDARLLIDLGFVDVVDVQGVGDPGPTETTRALVVRRSVRDYLYAYLPSSELTKNSRKALSLYFGENWNKGAIKPPANICFHDSGCKIWQIENANFMVLREVQEAVDSSGKRSSAARILAESYCIALNRGNHYGSIAALCGEVIPIFEQSSFDSKDLVNILSNYAHALRMTGDYVKAKETGLRIDTSNISNILKQDNLINLALVYEADSDKESASESARKCIKIDARTNHSLQARSIILNASAKTAERRNKLRKLEKEARGRRAFVVANNIAMILMDEIDEGIDFRVVASAVSDQAKKDDDYYNALRANIKLCGRIVGSGETLSINLLSAMITAYHYLHGENMLALFNNVHGILWRHFILTRENENLLRLFKYSSVMWRVQREGNLENLYVRQLSEIVKEKILEQMGDASRDLIYLMARNIEASKS
jgi:predicted MPP superfamily phosphohydrolase